MRAVEAELVKKGREMHMMGTNFRSMVSALGIVSMGWEIGRAHV